MMNTADIERKTYEIECLSPVHIGNGTVLKAFEYLYDKDAQKVYFVDQKKWLNFLSRHRMIDSFADYLQRRRGSNAWEWLRMNGITASELRKLAATVSDVTTNNKLVNRGSLNDIARQVVTADGAPYIPGSSIKGALRTGILYHAVKKEKGKYGEYWQRFSNSVRRSRSDRDVKKEAQRIMNDIENRVFYRLTMPSNGQRLPDAVRDVMRGLLVSDAHYVQPEHESVIVQKIDGTTKANKRGGQEASLPIFRECIKAGARLCCSVSMDKRMMREIGISSLDEIIAMTRDYIQEGLHMQSQVFGCVYKREFAAAEKADLLIGGGTGFLTKSIIYALAPSETEGRNVTAAYLDLAFREKGKHMQYDGKLSPRTVKLSRVGNSTDIMGLCYFHEVQ